MSTDGQDRTVTLPTLADNLKKIIRIYNVDSGSGRIKVDGEGAETINGKTEIYLPSRYDYIELIAGASEWIILHINVNIWSGWISRSDYTNAHCGYPNIDYDNLSGTFLLGEIVTEGTTGDTGIIIYDSGSTLIVYDVTGGGIFNNNNSLTGGTSGATALVNEAGTGTTKDLDSEIAHYFGKNLRELDVKVFFSSDGAEGNCIECLDKIWRYSTAGEFNQVYGIDLNQIDADNFTVHTGANGEIVLDAAGGIAYLGDEFINIKVSWRI